MGANFTSAEITQIHLDPGEKERAGPGLMPGPRWSTRQPARPRGAGLPPCATWVNLRSGGGQPVKEVVLPRINPVNTEGQAASAAPMNDSRRALYGAPVEGTVCPRPGITSRSQESPSASASQTASKASEWPPEKTSAGKPAEASASRGISA